MQRQQLLLLLLLCMLTDGSDGWGAANKQQQQERERHMLQLGYAAWPWWPVPHAFTHTPPGACRPQGWAAAAASRCCAVDCASGPLLYCLLPCDAGAGPARLKVLEMQVFGVWQ